MSATLYFKICGFDRKWKRNEAIEMKGSHGESDGDDPGMDDIEGSDLI